MAIFTTQWLKSFLTPKAKTISGDCKEEDCNKLLQIIIDGEGTKADQELFFQHMKDCTYCYNSYTLEKSIRKLLKTKIKKESVPEDLVDSIKLKIQGTQG